MLEANQRPTPWQLATTLLLTFAALPRLWSAWLDHGVYWPDEIYQSLEQGHRLAFGFGFIPWEFQDGARSWLFPGALGVLLKLSALVGVHDSLLLVAIAKTAMAALSVASVAGAMRIAEKLAGPAAGFAAGVIAAALPLSVQFSSRCLSETASTPAITFGVLLLLAAGSCDGAARERRLLASGALFGLACVLRYQTSVIPIALAAGLVFSGRSRDLKPYILGGVAIVAAGGLLDWMTWGAPFHSLWVYATFMTSAAHRFSDPAGFYPLYLWTSTGVALLPLTAFAFACGRKAWPLLGAFLAFVIFHELFPYNELRYLVPALPLFAALAAAGMVVVLQRFGVAAIVITSIALGVPLAWHARSDTFGDYGWYLGTPYETRSPWHFEEEINLLLNHVGRTPDVCGVLDFAGRHLIYNGGYTYLHRDVIILSLQEHPQYATSPKVAELANYAIVPREMAIPGYLPVETIGPDALLRRAGGCVAHPELDERKLEHP